MMTLTVHERILLDISVLPQQANWADLKIAQAIRKEVDFSQDEQEVLKFETVPETGGTKWDPDAPQEREFKIGRSAFDLIVRSLTKLSEAEKLTPEHKTLCEKFLDAEDE